MDISDGLDSIGLAMIVISIIWGQMVANIRLSKIDDRLKALEIPDDPGGE